MGTIWLKGHEISRYFFAPINTGYVDKANAFNDEYKNFHLKRSGKGIGITYLGNIPINIYYATNEKNVDFTKNDISEWKTLIKNIQQNGSLVGIQAGCRISSISPVIDISKVNKMTNFLKSQYEATVLYNAATCDRIVKSYIEFAKFVNKIGADVIQVHAAHGYALSQLISPHLNKRTDYYNVKELNILKDIIKGIQEVSKDIVIDIRISLDEGISKDIEIEKKIVIEKICELEIDIISFSNGLYDISKELIYPDVGGYNNNLNYVLNLAEKYNTKQFNISGGITSIVDLKTLNQTNISFSIGRSLIADPEFVIKEKQLIIPNDCIRCGGCHYYSNKKLKIKCPVEEI